MDLQDIITKLNMKFVFTQEVYNYNEEKYNCFFVEITLTNGLGYEMNVPIASPTNLISYVDTGTNVLAYLISSTTTPTK